MVHNISYIFQFDHSFPPFPIAVIACNAFLLLTYIIFSMRRTRHSYNRSVDNNKSVEHQYHRCKIKYISHYMNAIR